MHIASMKKSQHMTTRNDSILREEYRMMKTVQCVHERDAVQKQEVLCAHGEK